ncbi:MAG: hypothetical protein GY953_34645, partial [bacterium]|nr:hypothetical protein [bacterium]
GAFESVGLRGGRYWGYLLALTVLMAAAYYVVVIGWLLRYWVLFVTGEAALGTQPRELFESWLANASGQLLHVLPCVLVACAALGLGVRRGIERISRWIMPLFFLLFVGLVVRVLLLEDAIPRLASFFSAESSRFTPRTVLAAMGQALFSLGVGGTFMVIYGSYMRREENLARNATWTASLDVVASLLAALLIIPGALVYSVELASGPSLLFVVMPEIFSEMPGGRLVGAALLFAVILVAMLSLMASYEVVVAALGRGLRWSRKKALALLFVAQAVLIIPPVLSIDYVFWSDLIWGSTMQPVGAVVAVVALIWCLGKARSLAELTGDLDSPLVGWLYLWMKYVVPAGILTGLVYGWLG